jgi:hypothetical protein
MLKRI